MERLPRPCDTRAGRVSPCLPQHAQRDTAATAVEVTQVKTTAEGGLWLPVLQKRGAEEELAVLLSFYPCWLPLLLQCFLLFLWYRIIKERWKTNGWRTCFSLTLFWSLCVNQESAEGPVSAEVRHSSPLLAAPLCLQAKPRCLQVIALQSFSLVYKINGQR